MAATFQREQAVAAIVAYVRTGLRHTRPMTSPAVSTIVLIVTKRDAQWMNLAGSRVPTTNQGGKAMTDREASRKKWNIFATRKHVARRRLDEAKLATVDKQTAGYGPGLIIASTPRRHGRRQMASVGTTTTASGLLIDPREKLASMIQSALTHPPRSSTCTVYDANGTPIATIDPLTRQRTPITQEAK